MNITNVNIVPIESQNSTEKDLIVKLLTWMQETERASSEVKWREESEEDYKFYAGSQDTSEIVRLLALQNRPSTVFNEVKPKTDMIVGLGDQIRRVPTVLPVGKEDAPLAEVMNGVFKHYRYNVNLSDIEMSCFEHTVKSGRSFLYFHIDAQNPFKPQIKCKRLPGRQVWVDPLSIDYNLDDARFIFIDKWLTEDEVKAYYPDFLGELAVLNTGGSHFTDPTFFTEASNKYRLVEMWYRDPVPVIWFNNPITNIPEYVLKERWPTYVKALKAGIPLPNGETLQMSETPPYVEAIKKIIKYALLSGGQLLEYGVSPFKYDSFPIVLYGGYKDEDLNKWFGSIAMMKDPQRSLNTMRRQLTHLLQTAPKGILVHEAGALINEDEYKKHSSEPNFRLVVQEGKVDKVKFSNQPQISPVYGQLDGVFLDALKNVSGAQDPLMGIQTSSREPGVTARMRMESNIAVLYMMFGNFRKSRIRGGKILLSLIQQFVTMPEVIRIEGMNGMELLDINTQMNPQVTGFNDITIGKYDLAIDEESENVTMRRQTAMMLMEFAQTNPGTIPPELVMEYMDLPFSAKEQVKAYAEESYQRDLALQEAGKTKQT